jgi:hypothetical protein
MGSIGRRDLIAAASLGAVAFAAPDVFAAGDARSAAARVIPVDDPGFALRAWARLNGDPGGRVTWTCQGGMVYGFLPQGDDVKLADFARRLYQYRAVVARRMAFRPDGTLLVRQRMWNWYGDSESGEFHDEMLNPYTGRTVKSPPRTSPAFETVMSSAPPPPDTRGPYPAESSLTGRPMRLDYAAMGPHVWVRREQFNRFRPGDTTWYKLEGDMVTHVASLDALLDGGRGHITNTTSHNLVAEWQTWMQMHGSPGHILFLGHGAHVFRPDDLPASAQATIERLWPGTLAEPAKWA